MWSVQPFNGVGDLQKCQVSGHSTFTGKVTGPIHYYGGNRTPYWENAWYNPTICCLKITRVKVEYMDGSSYVYVRELPKILNGEFENDCGY